MTKEIPQTTFGLKRFDIKPFHTHALNNLLLFNGAQISYPDPISQILAKHRIPSSISPYELDHFPSINRPLKDAYPVSERLQIQQHDLLPLLVDQAIQIQNVVDNNLITLNPEVVSQIFKIREKPVNFSISRNLDLRTLETISLLLKATRWLRYELLEKTLHGPLWSIADDPWKLARIAQVTHYGEGYDATLIDGSEGQLEITALLLLHHAAYTSAQYPNLTTVLSTLESGEFTKNLLHLTPTANGVLIPDMQSGRFHAEYLTRDPNFPEISRQGKAYLKSRLAEQKMVYETRQATHRSLSYMPQKVCPAILRSFELTPEQPGELPPPGASQPAYIRRMQQLAATHPDILQISWEGDDKLHGKVITSPIEILHHSFIHYLKKISKIALQR